MQDISSYEDINEKSLEVILNFKPSEKFDKQSIEEIQKLKSSIKKAIALLNKEEQEVLELRYFQNLDTERISKVLNKSKEEITRILQKSIEIIKGKIKSGTLESKNSNVLEFISPKQSPEKELIKISPFMIGFIGMTVFVLVFVVTYYLLKKTIFNDMPLLSQIANETSDFVEKQVRNNQTIKKIIPLKGRNTSQSNSNNISLSGSTSLLLLSRKWENAFNIDYPKYRLSLVSSDSDKGIEALIDGRVDIANSSRPVGYIDQKKASEIGKELVEQRVALDALVIVVNKQNPVNELSLEDLEKIFSGEVKNWQALSGVNRAVTVLIREKGSGTNDFVLHRILQSSKFSSSAITGQSNQEIFKSIVEDEGAISFINSGNYPWDDEKVKYIKVKNYPNSPPVSPFVGKKLNEQVIRYGDYPLAHYLYLVSLADSPHKVRDFVEWVLSPKGQEVVRYSGLIPVFPN